MLDLQFTICDLWFVVCGLWFVDLKFKGKF